MQTLLEHLYKDIEQWDVIFEERKVAGEECCTYTKTVAQIIFTDGISVVWWDDNIQYTFIPSTAINKGSVLERYKSMRMRARFKPQSVSRRISLRI